MAIKRYVISTDEQALAELYREGLIGAWNGAYEADGTAVLAVPIHHAAALARMEARPALTLLPSHTDPGSKVTAKHAAALPAEVGAKAAKPVTSMTGRELADHLHATYRDVTAVLDPDGP